MARLVETDFWLDPRLVGVPFSAQVLWHRLMLVVDDHQCFRAEAAILKGRIFPLDLTVTAEHVAKWLSALKDANLVTLYADGQGMELMQLVKSPLRIQYQPKKRRHAAPPGEQAELPLARGPDGYDDDDPGGGGGRNCKIFPLVGVENESKSKSKYESESGAPVRAGVRSCDEKKDSKTRVLFARDEDSFPDDDLWRDLCVVLGLKEMTNNGAMWRMRYDEFPVAVREMVLELKVKTPDQRAAVGNWGGYATSLFTRIAKEAQAIQGQR
jgi:hypothetical protein